jgi:hypothetical protein
LCPDLARAFQDSGVRTLHVYDAFLQEACAADRVASRTLLNTDPAETAAHLSGLQPVAVLAGGENGIGLADDLAGRLGLPCNTPEHSAARRDKLLMYEAIERAGLAAPLFRAVDEESTIETALKEFRSRPVVVKPRSSAGGDNVRLCRDAQQARTAFRAIDGESNVLGRTNHGAVIVEYLDGPQFQVSTVSMAGRHLVTEFYRQRVDLVGHRSLSRYLYTLPADGPHQDTIAYALACLDALGVREGPANVELRLTDQGPRLVEVNSRMMGPMMDPDPYFRALGYAPQHLVAERYLSPTGFERRLASGYHPAQTLGRYYLRPCRAGRITRLLQFDQIRAMPGFYSAHRIPTIGSTIEDPHHTSPSSCTVYFVHEDPQVVARSLEALCTRDAAGGFFEVA